MSVLLCFMLVVHAFQGPHVAVHKCRGQLPWRCQSGVLPSPTIIASKFRRKPLLVCYLDGNTDDGDYKSKLTLEYSPNFRRHIVRQHGDIVQSFAWLDEAKECFPQAALLPVPLSYHRDKLPIAGGGGKSAKDATFYPQDDTCAADYDANVAEIREYLSTTLGWYQNQLDSFLETCHFLLVWPASLLRERMGFLLAPLPEDSVVADVNATVIDWPVQYYRHGRGAGMSVAQLSHALSVTPSLLFRDYETETLHSRVNSERLRKAKYLYEETPAVVMGLARKQLDALYGASSGDCLAYSYLHWKGWEFHQIRVVLQAFPGSVVCSLEPSWELFDRGASPVAKTLRSDSLTYMQHRLQIGPSHIQALLKTHTPLTYYSRDQLRRNCDALQDGLQLTSNELRSLVLRMPSLLGMSVKGLTRRIKFWTEEVGITVEELRGLVCSLESIIQYGVSSNLEPKLHFFREIGLCESAIRTLTISKPQVWGRSLEGYLRPLCTNLCKKCGNMTMIEFGFVLERAPEMALCNWKNNLEVKLDFMADRLDLSPDDLKSIVMKTPRVLMKGLKTSLSPKLDTLEEISSTDDTRQAILANPSLLLLSRASFQKCLDRISSIYAAENISLVEALNQTRTRRRRSKQVVCLLGADNEIVEQRFESVEEAASHANFSRSYMYSRLRQGHKIRGRRYILVSDDPGDSAKDPENRLVQPRDGNSNSCNDSLTRDIARLVSLEPRPLQKLTIYVAARAFPPEDILRGRRRAGGMALQIPSWTVQDWKKVVPQLWNGQRYRLLKDGNTLLLGYSYTKPSRSRCSLYACREALRAAQAWMTEYEDAFCATPKPLEIEIVTDSN